MKKYVPLVLLVIVLAVVYMVFFTEPSDTTQQQAPEAPVQTQEEQGIRLN